ncbi:MAG: TRAP transporter substrate-binding protein DctP [Rhodospirillales bacterium]|nr:TRAP transporter substrate-binding protein DctP [Rhodospirillales bacterium]
MKIRSLAIALLVGSAAFTTASAKTYTLKVANFTSVHSSTARWFETKKKEVAKKSGGKLKLEIFYGSAMGPMPRHYDLARTGVADLAFFQHGVTRGRFPLIELTHAPYLFPPGAKGAMVAGNVAADMKAPYFAAEHKGTKSIWVVYNRASGVYDGSKPIHGLADLKGRRYRAPTPTDVAMLKALGALPIGMPATHMAENLQKGTIDGVVTDPMGVFAFKLGGMVKYYTPMFVSAISFGLVMNPKSYYKLPADLRAIVDDLGSKKSSLQMSKWSWGVSSPRFTKYMKGAKLTNVDLSPAADKAMRAQATKVMAQRIAGLDKKGLPASAVYAKLKALSAKYSGM